MKPERETQPEIMPNYPCQHDGDGFYSDTETHHGSYEVWVCEECFEEVPIDLRRPERLKRANDPVRG